MLSLFHRQTREQAQTQSPKGLRNRLRYRCDISLKNSLSLFRLGITSKTRDRGSKLVVTEVKTRKTGLEYSPIWDVYGLNHGAYRCPPTCQQKLQHSHQHAVSGKDQAKDMEPRRRLGDLELMEGSGLDRPLAPYGRYAIDEKSCNR